MRDEKLRRPFGELPYRDLSHIRETYADGIGPTSLDGRIAHITLTVDRLAAPDPPREQSGERVTAARLVLDADTAIDLYNDLGRMMRELEKSGAVRMADGLAQRPG